jgi:winged helix DNA-binding protein
MTSWVLFMLAAEGRAVRTRPRGGWTSSQWSWMPADAPLETLEPEAARAELASRWLAVYGPGTENDLKWWTGWTLAQTRAALAAIGAEEVDLEGRLGFVARGDADEPGVEPWVALLPALDSTIMGWKERDWYLGEHGPMLFDRAGNAGPTIWSSGRVVGGWSIRKGGEVTWRLLEDAGAETAAAVESEAGRLEEWLAGKGVIPRFGTPLARELAI